MMTMMNAVIKLSSVSVDDSVIVVVKVNLQPICDWRNGHFPFVYIYRLAGGLSKVAVWLSGNGVGHVNEVSLHQAGLVLGWETIHGCTVLAFDQPTQANSAWPSLHG